MSKHAPEPVTDQPVHCRDCGHCWTGFQTPISLDGFVAAMAALACPGCNAPAKRINLGRPI